MKNSVLGNKVERGIEWLDEGCPNWASRIDAEILDLEDNEDCVLGQLFGTFNSQMKIHGRRKLIKLGFHFKPRHQKDKNWNKLNSIWANKVKERQCYNNDVNGAGTVCP